MSRPDKTGHMVAAMDGARVGVECFAAHERQGVRGRKGAGDQPKPPGIKPTATARPSAARLITASGSSRRVAVTSSARSPA